MCLVGQSSLRDVHIFVPETKNRTLVSETDYWNPSLFTNGLRNQHWDVLSKGTRRRMLSGTASRFSTCMFPMETTHPTTC